MRGSDERTGSLFSYVDLEARVRRDHPLRPIREIANAALRDLSEDFAALYPPRLGRPSIPPERLLRAMLLQAFYGIRSERQLMERMEFDLLFRWFVGLGLDDAAWDHSSFTTNRDRLLAGEIAAKFLAAVLAQPRVKRLISSEHFSVDGTLLEAWASTKSFRKLDGGDNDPDGPGRNAERGFHAEKRSNATHRSTTDPEARLYKKGGQAAKLCYMGHALMENRHGLAVDGLVTQATGTAEREAALAMLDRRPGRRRITLGADKGYDVAGFIGDLRARRVTPHIAIDGHLSSTGKPRKTAVGARTTRHPGYGVSQRCRKRIEEVFGWIKSSAGLAKVKLRGRAKVDAAFTLHLAAYNLIRLPKLLATAP
ncbi:MAG: IS5 family transposase [Pseudomonadota bacterium]|uniref:IS5 family transposase n=1 Tax=Phenylobacterium sp. TaxID=1871053 RepID=UPI0025FCFD05|nr:IS5 family transposase [Phenylobacterium sp.]MBT9471893.1 IS5 family transposase [Phenylobacterium sp.]